MNVQQEEMSETENNLLAKKKMKGGVFKRQGKKMSYKDKKQFIETTVCPAMKQRCDETFKGTYEKNNAMK